MAASRSVTVIPARKHVIENKDEEKPKLRVAAYCRVSTDSEEQATSYETQIEHYTAYIQGHPDWCWRGFLRMTASQVPIPKSAMSSTV